MIIYNRLNGRYYMSEKNATADDLIFTLVRALDMVVKDVARKKRIDPEVLMGRVVSALQVSAKYESLIPNEGGDQKTE